MQDTLPLIRKVFVLVAAQRPDNMGFIRIEILKGVTIPVQFGFEFFRPDEEFESVGRLNTHLSERIGVLRLEACKQRKDAPRSGIDPLSNPIPYCVAISMPPSPNQADFFYLELCGWQVCRPGEMVTDTGTESLASVLV